MRRAAVALAIAAGMSGAGICGGGQARAQPPRAQAEAGTEVPRARYPLRARTDGRGWVYEGPRFTATIALDGTVSFDDHRVSYAVAPLTSLLWGEGPYAMTDPAQAEVPSPTTEPTLPAYGSREFTRPSDLPAPSLDRMGQPDPPSSQRPPFQPSLIGNGFRFDVTDEILRLHGEDPYRQQKADFLAETFDFRLQLAGRAEQGTTRIALGQLPDYLAGIWADPRLGPAEKRQVLFALWQEADDTAAGHEARRVIETFIRTHLPAGSPYAYTERELAQYRADRESATFDPYGKA